MLCMERLPHNLLSIGTFVAARQLSLKALRLYDQLEISNRVDQLDGISMAVLSVA